MTEKVVLTKNKYAPLNYLELVKKTEGEAETSPKIYLIPSDYDLANRVLSTIKKEIIAIAPGGGNNAWMVMTCKRWSPLCFQRLIENLSINYAIVLLGGKEDVDISQVMLEKLFNHSIVDIIGKTTIRQAAAVLNKCKLFIGNDSALLHIAAAVDIPTISIFGPTDPAIFAPRGAKHYMIKSKLPCSPCFHYKTLPECKSIACMESIKPEEVIEHAKKLLSSLTIQVQ